MNCPYCGAIIADSKSFCTCCGEKLPQQSIEINEPYLTGFNFGAFALNGVWAFAHGMRKLGIIILALFFIPLIMPFVIDHINNTLFQLLAVFFTPLLVVIWFILSIGMGTRGNTLLFRSGKTFTSQNDFKNIQRKWALAGVLVLPIYIILFKPILNGAVYPFLHSMYNAQFVNCNQYLSNLSQALNTEISEQGSLTYIQSAEDLCHKFRQVYDTPDECHGQVAKTINEVCMDGTFRFNKIRDRSYEIKAKSNEQWNCEICVTEDGVWPEKYMKKQCRAPKCIHNP